ncbi:hypothetical protein C8R44DRAFT_869573 [Mycena epipterygia]|nr:hypothetical protein C8R44DRAFT_869573 [Mycena epipterygia]
MSIRDAHPLVRAVRCAEFEQRRVRGELMYAIREPYFAKDEHRERWRTASSTITERGVLRSGWMAYRGQSGQNFVFRDVKYTWTQFDSWSPEACMFHLVSTSPIQPISSANGKDSPRLPMVTIAVLPDSYTFQHHLDRVTHILAQGSHLLHGHRSAPRGVEAETMIFSCGAVLIHPWLSLKTLEAFGIKYDAARNKVVYMSRSDGRPSHVGRRVLNEADVLADIRRFLTERNRGEELVVFNPDDYENADQLFSWFSKTLQAAKPTLLIEMMSTTSCAMMIFEEASVLSQTYAAIVVEPPATDPSRTDMKIDV